MQYRTLLLLTFVTLAGCLPAKFTDIPAVSGRVVGSDGRPVSAATVEVSHGHASAKINVAADGTFHYPGQQRWIIWIVMADVFPELAEVQARTDGVASRVVEVDYRTEVIWFGASKPRVHDVGELRLVGRTPP